MKKERLLFFAIVFMLISCNGTPHNPTNEERAEDLISACIKDCLTYPESYETIFPEGIENVPKRFAIDFRNRWMIEKSDCVVTCINRGFGGAAKAKNYAEKHGKNIIEI